MQMGQGQSITQTTFEHIEVSQWQSDKEIRFCAICSSPFSTTRRKHHCRKCGLVICSTCSDNWKVNKDYRMCKDCLAKINESEEKKDGGLEKQGTEDNREEAEDDNGAGNRKKTERNISNNSDISNNVDNGEKGIKSSERNIKSTSADQGGSEINKNEENTDNKRNPNLDRENFTEEREKILEELYKSERMVKHSGEGVVIVGGFHRKSGVDFQNWVC